MSEPRSPQTLDDIVARCVEDVVRGYRSVEECLQVYPEQAEELKPLLLTALLTARLKGPQMGSEAVQALEARLRREMPKARRATRAQGLRYSAGRLAAMVAVVVLLAFGSGAGLVAASANTLPGDPLYGIKRLWEAILLAFSPLTGPQADLWQQIAQTRLNEVERLAAEGRLTAGALRDLYAAVYAFSGYSSAETDASILVFMNRGERLLLRIRPPAEAEAVYADVLAAMALTTRDGVVRQPEAALPPSEITPTATLMLTSTATTTPSSTPSATFTALPTLTATDVPSATPTATETPVPSATLTVTPSRTPRFPATATKTITPTITPTYTVTPSVTPTATWTELPLPIATFQPVPTDTPPPVSQATVDSSGGTEVEATRVRATQQAVYMTQTAGPPSTTPTSSP